MGQANFRVDDKQWDSFKNLCSSNGKSASEILKVFIDYVLDGRIDVTNLVDANVNPLDVEKLIEDKLKSSTKLLELEKRIAQLETNTTPVPASEVNDELDQLAEAKEILTEALKLKSNAGGAIKSEIRKTLELL